MSQPSPESKSLSLAYWTMNVTKPTGPVARAKLYELIDFDQRQTENSRFVYRFIVGWYHDEHGDALASVRHIVRAIRSRSPRGFGIRRDRRRSAPSSFSSRPAGSCAPSPAGGGARPDMCRCLMSWPPPLAVSFRP